MLIYMLDEVFITNPNIGNNNLVVRHCRLRHTPFGPSYNSDCRHPPAVTRSTVILMLKPFRVALVLNCLIT